MRPSFDLLDWPLDGVCLVEASAGTGKTWTICGLYLRLLVESGLEVRELLVVTFTTAATAELKERIRARLADLQRALRQTAASAVDDPFITAYLAMLAAPGPRHIDRATLTRRIDGALHAFDEAAVHTIHGFCQRALTEAPFAAGLPFAFEVLQSDKGLVAQVATDFYRRRVAGPSDDLDLAAHLRLRCPPERLAALLSQRLARPLDRLDIAVAPASGAFAAYCRAFAATRAQWLAERDTIVALLEGARGQLNGVSYRADTISKAARAVDDLLLQPYAASFERGDDPTRYLQTSHLAAKTKKGSATPQHRFFDLLDALHTLDEAAVQDLDGAELALIRDLLTEAPDAVRAQKRRQRVIAYDDMLANLRDALADPQLAWLATALRQRYPVALIDEFQDTDPQQFEIFSRIYQPAESAQPAGPLFLVGDPKQAIYRFRGADLFTYLKAAGDAAQTFNLAVNQRSIAPLIAAQNALFTGHARPFVLPGLDYHPVQAGSRTRPAFADAAHDSALVLWQLPQDLMTKGSAERRAISATAAEVARLLGDARRGSVSFGTRPLAAGDIAIIVRTHQQGQAIKRALLTLGIGSVERAQDNVFRSDQALVLELFLRALAEPGHDRALNATLASELFGLNATVLHAENSDPAGRAARLADFAAYRTLWLQHGFAALWRKVQRETRLAQRLLALPDGDRRMTNYLHLGELLHAESEHHPGMDSLRRWMVDQRHDEQTPESTQLRLESDEHLVQIATVHAAKGLEYPVTFCPFLWFDGARPKAEPWRSNFHDDEQRAVTRYATDDAEGDARERLENFAESVRNLYVALTRAVYRTYLVTGLCNFKGDKGRSSRASALNWLVAGAGQDARDWLAEPADVPRIATAWSAWAQQCGPVVLATDVPDADSVPVPAARAAVTPGLARVMQRRILPGWTSASFTSLSRQVTQGETPPAELEHGGNAVDHDQDASGPDPGDDPGTAPASIDMLAFPRGAEAGTLLHAAFEHADLADPASWPRAIDRALARHPLALPGLDHAAAAPALRAMLLAALQQVAAADLDGTGLRLADVPSAERLNELGFCLPARGVDLGTLATALAAPGLSFALPAGHTLDGFLRGTIDFVFRLKGRYYLADWKSNFLGSTAADYRALALAGAMAQGAYTLQSALYSLALHRFLRTRVANYDYERDCGGVFYVFVRGVRPDWRQDDGGSCGIHRDRLPWATVDRLDRLFDGLIEAGA